MSGDKTILVVGTYDTKQDELSFIATCIKEAGRQVLSMDVSVLGDPSEPADISKQDVAVAAGTNIDVVIESGDESLGKSALQYMVPLKPALEARGYEVAIFHATGMGGRAFESLAAQGVFACVFDFCIQELGNEVHGSSITAGPSRLTGAGLAGIPQIVAPGCVDLVDIVSSEPIPEHWQHHLTHVHNRLITSVVLNNDERCVVANAITDQLALATSNAVFLLPLAGCGEWDREGADLHNAEGHAVFCDQIRQRCPDNVALEEVDAHINDEEFAQRALAVFDRWCDQGIVSG